MCQNNFHVRYVQQRTKKICHIIEISARKVSTSVYSINLFCTNLNLLCNWRGRLKETKKERKRKRKSYLFSGDKLQI